MSKSKIIPLCDLKKPAECRHLIYGKCAGINLCSGTDTGYDTVKDCPHRKVFGLAAKL